MAELTQLVQLLQQQIAAQQKNMEAQQQQHRDAQQHQIEESRKQMEALITAFTSMKDKREPEQPTSISHPIAIPNFVPFDATTELWTDYWARFQTFVGANSVPVGKQAQVFLTNQSRVNYKLLSNLASQQSSPKDINELTLDEIAEFMKGQFDPARYVVRERFKFWSAMDRKPGETVHELAARIRHDAVTCDFPSISDPLDEAMRTRFMCSVNNEAVLKALFKHKEDDLTFAKAVAVAVETEEAAKVAKETVHGVVSNPIHLVEASKRRSPSPGSGSLHKTVYRGSDFPTGTCPRCGKTDHKSADCPFKDATCRFCQKSGHLEAVCLKKRGRTHQVKPISKHRIQTVKAIETVPQLQQSICIQDKEFVFEVDTGAGDNFCSTDIWKKAGEPALSPVTGRYEVANGQPLPTLGMFETIVSLPGDMSPKKSLQFTVTKVPQLNLLGRDAIVRLGINLSALLGVTHVGKPSSSLVLPIFDELKPDLVLQDSCRQLCQEFPDLFKPELGCLKGFQLEVKFKPEAQPIFCRPRVVPFAIQDDLCQAYDAGIAGGVWQPTQFCAYGTPVVPIRKAAIPGKPAKLRVCGDYSITVNHQLEPHRHPMPLPEDLMRKLGGGYGFTKVDLADAYNQIMLAPESQKRLALSTHRGVLLQMRLPFGISSAPGYFQEIMDQLTSDLRGVAVYIDDILVSGTTASEHLQNLRALFQRLESKGLRCRLEKCVFAQPCVEYLGHILSGHGIAKGPKVNDVMRMPAPGNVSGLRSFLGSVQFYSKFLPNLATLTEPLHRLTKNDTPWIWGAEEKAAFQKLKDLLCADSVLVHFDPSLPVGISCDASEVGLGAVLFHRYPDGSERPIANASKTLTSTQRRYSQIQKEALAIIFALNKFHQFLYGRSFILVTDHKPLIVLFGPTKATPALAANRLARWALTLSQYQYTIEYRKTCDHSNADALSRLPVGPDASFDEEEDEADVDTVCTIKTVSLQLDPTDPGTMAKESAKDPVIANVMRFTREGWPPKDKREASNDGSIEDFRKVAVSLSTAHGCLLYGSRVVIPLSLRPQVLQLLHLGHFGMQRMKQLARTAVYWPRIDADIVDLCHRCTACAEHQIQPPKPANHPWMLPERPWSRVHVDHAINFLGSNWLVLIDAYSKYPCIHPTTSTSTKSTTELLEQDFAHFGYPHTIVSDNATSFSSEEFQAWCRERGITHLTGAPYHPATNGAAERLVQTFKQALCKSSLPPRAALQEFLMQYRRTPLADTYFPSELLNGRQIRTKIDVLLPSPAHIAQGKQARSATRSQEQEFSNRVTPIYSVGSPCYALYCGPRREKDPRWVPAVVTKRFGTRSVSVRVVPRGGTWRRHIEQLRPRYVDQDDTDPGDMPIQASEPAVSVQDDAALLLEDTPSMEMTQVSTTPVPMAPPAKKARNPRLPTGDEYGPHNPRRSSRRPLSKNPEFSAL